MNTEVSTEPLVFFYAPQTRAGGVLALLEELHADYRLRVLDFSRKENQGADFLAINPLGKVPAILHGDAVVTEQAAIYQYLAENFPQAGLAPTAGDPLRGPFLRWLAFYGSCFEPAVVDRSMQREPTPYSRSPYGDYDRVLATLRAQLASGPWLLGERFTAADVLWGSALQWTMQFGLVPGWPEFSAYCERLAARPAIQRARARDAELVAAMQK